MHSITPIPNSTIAVPYTARNTRLAYHCRRYQKSRGSRFMVALFMVASSGIIPWEGHRGMNPPPNGRSLRSITYRVTRALPGLRVLLSNGVPSPFPIPRYPQNGAQRPSVRRGIYPPMTFRQAGDSSPGTFPQTRDSRPDVHPPAYIPQCSRPLDVRHGVRYPASRAASTNACLSAGYSDWYSGWYLS